MLEKMSKASTGQAQDHGLEEDCGHVRFESGLKMHASIKAQELRQRSGWEMLSLEGALTSMERMPQRPSVEYLAYTLQNCIAKKNIAFTKRLYAHMCKSGIADDISVGNGLVEKLVHVGSMCDAQQAFNKLLIRNVSSWTSLIRGYIECGDSKHALNLYQKMQEDSVQPSKYTFLAVLKACARLKDAARGREIHVEIARWELEKNIFVGSTLVDMYAKCKALAEAREVFDKLPIRNEVSWNALMAGYAEQGLSEEVLDCLEHMKLEGLSPDGVTFVSSLKACGSIRAIDKGREIHAEIARKGLRRDLYLGSTLVGMYAKCGSVGEAREAFADLPVRNEILWNALMAGYAEQGLGEEALNCLEQMRREGLSPTAVTFVCSLKACGSIGTIDKGREIHAEISRKGMERDLLVGSTLVDMYAKCSLLAEAREAFEMMPGRNEVSWNVLIAGYATLGLGEEALSCLKEMQLEGLSPNTVTFVCSLKACGSIGVIDEGQEIHAEIGRKGLERHLVVGNTLVDMYCKCGFLAEAQEAFDKLPVQDVVSWTALIAGYAEQGVAEEALYCLEQMQKEGLSPNAVTIICSLKACGSMGAIDKGREIHTKIARKGLERDLVVGNSLVDMYAQGGSLAEVREVFDKLPVRNEVSWTALMAGYAQQGESDIVFHMLERMRGEGVKADGVTFSIVLTVCSHTGLVFKGQKYFGSMNRDYGVARTMEHHVGLVDLLGCAGQLDEAVAMVKRMPFHPNLLVWHTMLGACQKWGNAELGRLAFEHAVQLDKKSPASYVLMSNIYADAHMQEEEKKVRQ